MEIAHRVIIHAALFLLSPTMKIVYRVIIHAALFLLSPLIFLVGLGVGLALNPLIGSILWIVAGAVVVLNLIWMFNWIKDLRRV